MPMVELQAHAVIVSPLLRELVDELDPAVMPDFEKQAYDFIEQSVLPGSVNTDNIDIGPVIYHLYELFSGSFVIHAMNRRVSEQTRARELAAVIRRMLFNSYINPETGVYTVVMDGCASLNFLNRCAWSPVQSFLNLKYQHEMTLNSIN